MLSGYSRQLSYLDSILKSGCVPHAFLLHGPDQAASRRVSRSFICRLNNPGLESWSEADAVVPANPDIYLVQKLPDKKEIGVGQIRQLRTFISRSAWGGRFKAAVVEDAHFLSEEGWDALLKTLEEPPAGSVIFLLSASLNVIPKTIISRALCLNFANPTISSSRKDDIIIGKLAGGGLSVLECLTAAEKLVRLIGLRQRFCAEPNRRPRLAAIINSVVRAKKIIVGTNANPRLVLENLLLRLGQS